MTTASIKILHLIAGAPCGGAETFCLDAIKSLHGQGLSQHVICRPHPHVLAALQSRNIPYDIITFSRFRKPWEQAKIRRILRQSRPDLVHCWMNRAASFIPRGTEPPVLGWFGGYYKLKNYRNCDFYMGVTRGIVRHIIQKSGKPHRSFLVHTFGTLEECMPVTRADFNIPDDAKTVLLLSRMHRKKGIDTLLHAARQVKNAHFLLAGDGPDTDRYKKLAQRLNLQDRVHFLGWRNDRAALLKIADVCVLPSRYEPYGTVIAEAWYAGIPLVATRAAGAKEYVTHNLDGLLCDIDDCDALATQIDTALHDRATRERLVMNGCRTYERFFSKAVVTKALVQSYHAIIRAGKRTKNPRNGEDCGHYALKPALSPQAWNDPAARAVAGAYLCAYEDPSLALDAAEMQSDGFYDFLKKTPLASRTEILSEAEMHILATVWKDLQAAARPHETVS